ncbi:helix-turn-helix domain-containing protein [Cupriavidus pauculus]|jgi:transcriptional regulator with XRE-family HTH domain|uniref:helix-turn-helix domain-containing protein n=1 Tax=Cupriavidus pauculus TaxID=82633 RepID=UPI00147833B2|nr:helix-turn-helix transcriptional regulator [Cupriavidus pauculus]UAK99561.1 helix-turn-helix domain-containing protein [Cupriavidus pauculus]
MSYTELIQRALHGRSVLQAAKELGLPQSTLHNYCSGKRMPDYLTAFMLAKEAGVDPREMFMALVEEDAKKKGVLEKISEGFNALLSLVKPRRDWVPAC